MTMLVRPCISRSSASCTRALDSNRAPRWPVEDEDGVLCRSPARSPGAGAGRPRDCRCGRISGVDALRQRSTCSSRLAPASAARTRSWSSVRPRATLAAMLSLNSTTSRLTSANWRRSACTSQSASAMPSRRSARGGLDEARQQVDERGLPAPEGPTSATVSPGCRAMLTLSSAGVAASGVCSRPTSCSSARRGSGAGAVAAAQLRPASVDQPHAALQRRHAARDRAGDFREVLDRRHQPQHPSRRRRSPPTEPPLWPLCHSATTITAESERGIICVMASWSRPRPWSLIAMAAQPLAERGEARRLAGLRRMRAHDAPGQHVLLDLM